VLLSLRHSLPFWRLVPAEARNPGRGRTCFRHRSGVEWRQRTGECDGDRAFHDHDSGGNDVGKFPASGLRFVSDAIDRDYAGFRQRIGVYGRGGVNRKQPDIK